VLSVVGSLISGGTHTDGPARRRSQVIGRRTPGAPLDPTADGPVPERYIVPSPRGMLRLIAGMVRANRPWRLFTALSRALAGVFATAAYGMINNTAWQIAASLDTWRQLLVTVLSVLALTAWIIVDHELWERPDGDLPRALSRLYNLVTSLTIGLGVLFLYAVLFVVLNAVAALLLSPSVLGQVLTHRPTVTEYLALSWFVTSLAMIGGAFGSGLEDDGTVRNAAYGRRQRSRREQLKSSEADPGAGRADS
jgi:hypothetical protein